MTGSLFFFFKLNLTFEKLQEKKYELPSNEQMISYLYELKLSIWKLASPQDENPLKTDRKNRKKHSPRIPCYKSGSPMRPPPTAVHSTFLPVFVLHKQ